MTAAAAAAPAKPRPIDAAWRQYQRRHLTGAPDLVVEGIRRAFYSGACGLYVALMSAGERDDDDDGDDVAAVLVEARRELSDFAVEVVTSLAPKVRN